MVISNYLSRKNNNKKLLGLRLKMPERSRENSLK